MKLEGAAGTKRGSVSRVKLMALKQIDRIEILELFNAIPTYF
jgi:hypothetical protein